MDLALEYRAERKAALVPVPSPRVTNACPVLVRTLASGISRGTERLVFEGRVPEGERERMRAPFQRGDFPFPVVYGYGAVGVVEAGPGHLTGRTVFSLHPHQTRFAVPEEAVTVLPEGLPPPRATLGANMETALNAAWDGGAGPGDRIAVVGGGVLGALIAGLCAGIAGAEVTVVDLDPARRAPCDDMGAAFALPGDAPEGCDVVFHASASAGGLATAIGCAGFEATIVEASWYGAGETPAPLGGAFHSQRLRLACSQVGHVAGTRRARWSRGRRLAKALDLLRDPRFDALLTWEVDFAALPDALPRILAPDAGGLATVVRYPEG